jgi:hypothetical protein
MDGISDELQTQVRGPADGSLWSGHVSDFAPDQTLPRTLEEALAETDYLPFHGNYAHRLFQEFGGIEGSKRAVGQVYPLPRPRPESGLQGLVQRLASVSSIFTQVTGVLGQGKTTATGWREPGKYD